MEDLAAKIKGLIADEMGYDEAEVTDNADLSIDLGADSLDVVEIVMRLEEEFEIEIPDTDADKFDGARVGFIVEYMEKRLRQTAAKAG